MYTETFNKGDVVPVFALAGVTEDGTRIPLGAADFNFDFWEYFNGPILAARGGTRGVCVLSSTRLLHARGFI